MPEPTAMIAHKELQTAVYFDGETLSEMFTFVNEAGNYIDLTGWSFEFEVRDEDDNVIYANSVFDYNTAAKGVLTVEKNTNSGLIDASSDGIVIDEMLTWSLRTTDTGSDKVENQGRLVVRQTKQS